MGQNVPTWTHISIVEWNGFSWQDSAYLLIPADRLLLSKSTWSCPPLLSQIPPYLLVLIWDYFCFFPPLSLILSGRIKYSVLGLYFCNMVSGTILRYLVNLPPHPDIFLRVGHIAYVKWCALSTLSSRYFRSRVIWARNSLSVKRKARSTLIL